MTFTLPWGQRAYNALPPDRHATPFGLDSPHQANLYRSCARLDYRDAATKYIRQLGGERALPEAMETWELNHPAEMA